MRYFPYSRFWGSEGSVGIAKINTTWGLGFVYGFVYGYENVQDYGERIAVFSRLWVEWGVGIIFVFEGLKWGERHANTGIDIVYYLLGISFSGGLWVLGWVLWVLGWFLWVLWERGRFGGGKGRTP